MSRLPFTVILVMLVATLPNAALADSLLPCSQYKQTSSNAGDCGDCFITFVLKDPSHQPPRAEYLVTSSNNWTAAVIAQGKNGAWTGGGYWGAVGGTFDRQAFLLALSTKGGPLHLEMQMGNPTLGRVSADFRCFQ